MRFKFEVIVECDTEAQAEQVLAERFDYDEEYADPETGEPFAYKIERFELEGTIW